MKRPSSKPSPRKNGSSNAQTTTSQTASTNWTGQSRLFCSGWELDTTDLTPTCTTSSMLASLRCAHARQTSWLQNIYCSTVNYMMLWGGTHGRIQRFWGTSCMATWRSWGGQPPSWGQQASPSSVWWRRRKGRVIGGDGGRRERRMGLGHSLFWDECMCCMKLCMYQCRLCVCVWDRAGMGKY